MKNILFIITLILFSCTNVSYNQLSGDIEIDVTANLEADITVGEKITGTGTETTVLFIFRLPGTRYRAEGYTSMTSNSPASFNTPIFSSFFSSLNPFTVIEHAKGEAVHDAIESSNADLIINPQFKITENDYLFYRTVKCEVTGKKGTIKKIK